MTESSRTRALVEGFTAAWARPTADGLAAMCTDASAMIAFRLRCTLGTKPFELRVIDRIAERGGLVADREAYYDSLRFLLEVLRRPSACPGYLRYRGYLPGR